MSKASVLTHSQPGHPTDLIEILAWRARHQPERLAYRFLEDDEQAVCASPCRQLSYHALLQRVEARAATLVGAARAAGSHVLLSYPPGLAFVVAYFACLRAGAIPVPAPPPGRGSRQQRFLDIVQDARPVAVLTSDTTRAAVERALGSLPSPATIPVVTEDGADPACAALPAYAPRRPDETALLQYTSGSTGSPRGVVVSQANLLDNLAQIRDRFGHTSDSRGVIWLPPYHDMGLIGGILQPLFVGFPVTLMAPLAFVRRPLRWLQAIDHFGATTSGGPNFAYQHCLDRIQPSDRIALDLSRWQVAFTGAEAVRATTLQEFTEAFAPQGFRRSAWLPCYGLAEATLLVSGSRLDSGPRILALDADALARREVRPRPEGRGVRRLVGSGRVAAHHEVEICEPASGQPLGAGRIGEIWVTGAGVADGYLGQARENRQAFEARTPDGKGAYLRTGDLGFVHDGELFVSGRLKELIILRGRNLFPADLEFSVEGSHEALRHDASAVFSVDGARGERLVVVHETGRHFDRSVLTSVYAEIRRALAADFGVSPDEIVLIKPGRLPRTPSGKIRRMACRDQYLRDSLPAVDRWRAAVDHPSQPRAPGNLLTAGQVEAWMRGWLAERLATSPAEIDPNRPLAEFGLDSVAAVELAQDLSTLANCAAPLSETLAWRYPTIATLAAYVAGGMTATGTVEPPIQRAPAEIDASTDAVTDPSGELEDAADLLAAELERARGRSA
ncbi:MAG: AMP-binding protein [Pseudomonadota bacterium]